MRTRGYETLRLTRSVLASAALRRTVFNRHEKAFLKDVFEQLGFKQLESVCRHACQPRVAVWLNLNLLARTAYGPYGVRLSP